MKDTYRIVDEPRPGALERVVVRPMWPLLGSMLGITVFGWVWFIINGIGMGSPSRGKEMGWAAIGLVGGYIILIGLFLTAEALAVPSSSQKMLAPYLMLGMLVWKLFVSYRLQMYQERVYEIYAYYSGQERSGLWMVMLLFFGSGSIVRLLPEGQWVWFLPLL